jgi:hypothetical protein
VLSWRIRQTDTLRAASLFAPKQGAERERILVPSLSMPLAYAEGSGSEAPEAPEAPGTS